MLNHNVGLNSCIYILLKLSTYTQFKHQKNICYSIIITQLLLISSNSLLSACCPSNHTIIQFPVDQGLQ